MALRILYRSPQAYKALSKILDLPGIMRLKLYVRRKISKLKPGFSPAILELLKIRCSTMNDLEKNCTLVPD